MTQELPTISPKTVNGINLLTYDEIRSIYAQVIPPEILQRFNLSADLYDQDGNDLLQLVCRPGSSDAEMSLFHRSNAQDPVLYGHITDTISNQIHILLYIINDPESERFNIDRMPDGTSTMLGAIKRNIEEEIRSMQAGLAPGQIHRGLRLLHPATNQFEKFVQSLGHELYFTEPLFYHTALIFERYGFAYQSGRKLMETISEGFAPGGDLQSRLDGFTPFRQPEAINSIRLRSWAIHDGILGEPFTNVTMYKRVGISAGINTSADCPW
jgi:hypothetical protein